MGMTMTQKILAKHAGLESVTAGQLIEANVDLTLANDITGPVAIREMEKAGFDVCRYVSIDRLCERHAGAYYEALNACLGSWDTKECDYSPFVELWLSLLSEAYRMLLAAMENAPAGSPTKAQQVRDLFALRSNPLTKAQVVAALPDVSLSTIENALRALAQEGYLEKIGAGRSTAYLRK